MVLDAHASLFPKASLDNLRSCIISPVINESASLRTTLRAPENQKRYDEFPFDAPRYEIPLPANNCTDDTAAVARYFGKCYPLLSVQVAEIELPPELANRGRVHGLLMDIACARLFRVNASHAGSAIIAYGMLKVKHLEDQALVDILR